MKGCLVALGILVSLVVLVVGYLWLSFYDIHVRYRLTIEVQGGDQIKTGSSVLDASYTIQPDYIWRALTLTSALMDMRQPSTSVKRGCSF
jgi:hypothetical protein